MESGLVERNYPDSSNEVASMLSSSHKRVKCISPAVFGTAPEAKRSMLYFNNGVDLPALAIAEQENMASLGSMSESYSGLVERFANVKTNVNELKDENRFEGTHNARDSGDQNSPTLRQLIFQCDLSPDIIELNNNRNYDETKVAEKDSIDRLYEEICRIVNRQSVSSGSSSSSSSSDAAKMLTNGLPCSRNISANIAANIVKINEEGRSAAEEREHTAIAKMNLYTPADSIAEKENDNIGNRKKILYEVEDRDAMTNIASTTDYIGSLMKLVGDSSFNNTSTSSENIDAYISRDVEKDTKLYDHVVPTDKKYGTEEVNDEITHVIQSADEDDRKEKNVSADEDLYNKEVLQSEEEDDYLLNNLPKSVDDFQSRDYRLKLVRNLSSPRALSNVLQSPGYESSLPSAASLTPASVAVKNAFSFNGNVIWNGESSTFSSARAAFVGSYINSRTMSNASENPLDNDVDPNDLEVAMINESFEEQLKQTRIYQRDDLRDIFYGAPSNTALTTDCGVPLAQKMFFSNSPIDPNQPSTSSMGMYLNVTSASDDSDADVAKLDAMVAENLLHMRDHTIVPHDETDDDDDYDDENDDDNDVKDEGDEDNISKDESFASDVDKRDGTPVCSRRNLFIPVLTPQSRQLVMQQRKSFARTGKYRIPTMAPAAVVNNKDDVFPNGYPLLDPQLFERSTEKFADDAETARVLAHEDILNNFGLTTPANRVYSIGDDKSSTSRNTCAQTTSNDNNQQKHDSGKLFSNAVWEAICSNNIQSEKSPDVARMAANLPPEFRAMFISGSERMEISPYLTSLMTYDDQLPIGDVNEIVETRNDADELSDNAIAEMVAYNAVRMVIDSPIFMNEDGESEKIATSTPKNTASRLPCFEMLNVRKCDTSSEEAAGDTTTYNSGGDDDLGGVAEEDGSIELSTADIVDSTSDFTHSLSMARLLFDDTDEFDEAEKFKSLNLNNNNSKDVVDREDEVETQGTLELPNTFGLPMSVTTAGLAASSASSSMSSFSMMDKSPKTDSNADEQTVPVLDSWEHLDDDEELANKMISEAKAKIKAQQSDDAAFSNHASTCSSPVVINTNENDVLGEMPHVIEASYSGTVRSEEEVAAAIRQLSGGATDVWYRKVDAKHYLIIFSNADRASDAMLIKCRTTFLQLNSLDHASGVTRRAAVAQKSQLLPKRNRPATTVKVARRLIENALEMRIDVTPEQREKEMRQLAEAKENKRQKKAMWDNN